jgi:hypothetical protein
MGERRGTRIPVVRLVVGELVLFATFYFSGSILGTVPLAHFSAWLRQSAPQDAFTALVRLGGLVVSSWLLITTAVYVLGKLAGIRSLVRGSSWATLPVVRRVVDGVAAASILAATVAASTGIASAAPVRPAAHTRVMRAPVPKREKAEVPETTAPVVTSTAHVNRQVVGRHLPHPGVILHNVPLQPAAMPNPAAPSPANGFAGLAPGTKVVVVQPGDCLSVLAQRHLGSWQRYHEISALNMGHAQADGGSLQQEHWIYPQWTLVMPADAVGTLVVGSPAAGPAATPATSSAPAAAPAPAPAPAPVAAPAPALSPAVAPATGQAAAVASGPLIPPSVHNGVGRGPAVVTGPAASIRGQAPVAPAAHRTSSAAVSWIPVAELAGGGVALGAFLLLLGRLRTAQAARRKLGERAPRPTGEQALVELAARVASDESMVQFLDAGLRLLTVSLTAAGFVAPPIIGAEVHPDQLILILAEATDDIPEGFSAGQDATEWVLWYPETAAEFDELAAGVSDVVAALPSLVALGRDGNVTVLVNLEAVGVVTLGGDDTLASEVVASVAMELAGSPWSELCRVVLVGMGRPDGLGRAEPVELYRHLGDCLADLSAQAEEVRRAAADNEMGSLAELRIGAGMGDVGPVIVLCADEPDQEHLAELIALASDPTSGVAGVVVAPELAGDWALEIEEGRMDVGPLGRLVVPQRLSRAVLATMESGLAVAASDPEPAAVRADVDDADDEREDDWFAAAGGDEHGQVDAAEAEDEEDDESSEIDGGVDDLDGEPEDEEAPEQVPVGAGPVDPVVDEVFEALAGDDAGGVGRPPRRLTVVPSETPPIAELVMRIISELLPDVVQDPDLLVAVMGPEPLFYRLAGPDAGPIDFTGRNAALEAAVYVALHGEPVYATRVQEVVYPEQAARSQINLNSFQTTMSGARKRLGRDRENRPCLSFIKKGKFSMSPGTVTDWGLFKLLCLEADKPAPVQKKIRYLASALALLGAEGPFAQVLRQQDHQRKAVAAAKKRSEAKRWVWLEVEQVMAEMQAEIVDAASFLAQLLTDEGDNAGARLALRTGFKVTRTNKGLWSQAMDLAAADNNWVALELIREAWERVVETDVEPYGDFDSLRDHYQRLLQHA